MGMELHGLTHYIGHLVEAAVIHIEQGLEDTPLYRLQAVMDVGNSPLPDNVGGVFKEILFKEVMQSAVL